MARPDAGKSSPSIAWPESIALSNIGLIAEQLEDFHRALRFIEESWALKQTVATSAGQALNVGVLLSRVGEAERALPMLEKAITLANARRDWVSHLNAKACMADVESRLGTVSRRKIEPLFRQVLDQVQEQGLADVEAGARSLYGEHMLRQGRIDEAIVECERALRLLEDAPQSMQRRVTLTWIAPVYARAGRWQAAYEALHEAAEARKKLLMSGEVWTGSARGHGGRLARTAVGAEFGGVSDLEAPTVGRPGGRIRERSRSPP